MEKSAQRDSRFGESQVLKECHDLVKKLKAKKQIMPSKKKPKMLSKFQKLPEKQPKQRHMKVKAEERDEVYFCRPELALPFLQKGRSRQFVSTPYYAKDTYRSALMRNLQDRVQVQQNDAMTEPQDIEDVDSEFFSAIKHKIPRNKVDVRSYVQIIRSILRTQICKGYVFDEATFIKEKFLNEKSVLNTYTNKFQVYFTELENYMATKHAESMRLLRLSVIATNETEKKHEEVVLLETELNKIKLSLIEYEDVWRSYRMYQDFLFQIAPIAWRKEHDKHFHPQAPNPFLKDISRHLQTGIDKYDLIIGGRIECLEELMILFLKDFQHINKPVQYFSSPHQIKEIFHELELKNLNSLLHLRELQGPEQIMRTGLEITSKYYAMESQSTSERLRVVEADVAKEELRKDEIKHKVEMLLQGVLRRLLVSKEILRLQVFIEDVYATCVGAVDWRMSALEMVQVMEHNIERQLMLLDSYLPQVVADATKQEQKATALAMRKAMEARRKVMDLDSLLQAMKRLLKRVSTQPRRTVMLRSEIQRKARRVTTVEGREKRDQNEDEYYFSKIRVETPKFNTLTKVALLG